MSKCVVVASYDPQIRKRQQSLFDGFDVRLHAVANGEDALLAVRNENPDLVLIDPMLPRLSGFEVSRQVRETRPDLPIIMLTSVYRGMIYRTEALHRYGATEYFEEPVDSGTFRRALERHLGTAVSGKKAEPYASGTGSKGKKSTRRRLEAILQETGAGKART